jgi:hypothetical protein
MRLVTTVAMVLVLGLSACGGDDAKDNAAGNADPDQARQQAALEASQCMRDKGFDVPDPVFDANGGATMTMEAGSELDMDSPEFQAASEECHEKLDSLIGDGDDRTPQEKQEFQDQMLEFAQCMRDNGVDMPDPQFDDKGRVRMQMQNKGELVDRGAFEKAQKACEGKNAIGIGGGGSGGGPSSTTKDGDQ